MKLPNLNIKLGKDVEGNYFSYDIGQMHHLLIGGEAGSGKTQFIHNTILLLTQNNSSEELKLIMFDGNGVDLNIYAKIPHMLSPVLNEVIKFRAAIKWLDHENDKRLELLKKDRNTLFPKIVVIINELADVFHDYKNIENSIVKIIQYSKYTGIYFIFGTNSENGKIDKGIIIANVISRVAFKTKDARASRVILNQNGAEKLNGKGDMLFMSPVSIMPIRLQADYISEQEINDKIENLSKQEPVYNEELLNAIQNIDYEFTKEELNDAIKVLKEAGEIRTSALMVGLKISYAKANKIMENLEKKKIISKFDLYTKRREFIDTK